MEKQEQLFKTGQRVRLKSEGQDNLYAWAFPGSEGWVRDAQLDDMGYPMIYVEWDKNHWTYNGEANRWTFESHFELVEENMEEKKPEEFDDLLKQFQEFLIAKKKADEPEPEPARGDSLSEYKERLGRAIEVAKAADSFLIITVTREYPDGPEGIPLLVPDVVNSYQSPEAGYLLESRLSALAAMSHQDMALDAIRKELEGES